MNIDSDMGRDRGRLCVKGLADGLGVSTRYVYEMRACGFEMTGIHQAATLKQAVEWIEANDFRIINGRGRVQKSANPAA